MPWYRLNFPSPPDVAWQNEPTADIDSGDKVYEVGDVIEHGGKRWKVSEVPGDDDDDVSGGIADLMLWPAD